MRELLRRCLNRDPHERLRDIGDARLELAVALSGSQGAEAVAGTRPIWTVGIIAATLGFGAGAAILWGLGSHGAPAAQARSSSLVWVDRRGVVEEVAHLPFAVPHFALSPDGSRVAMTGREGGAARIDLHDLSRGTAMRLVDRDVDWPSGLVFSADGRRLFFGSWGPQPGEILSLPTDGSSGAERILTLPGTFFTTPGSVSPGGRFLAYVSNEAGGEGSIYVQRFPEGDAKTRVSPEGGDGPQWAPDGRELFYQDPSGRKLFAVSVGRDPGLSFGAPRLLFEGPYLASLDAGLSYAVSPDARRFLMTRQPNAWPLRASELIVVQNWFEDVRRLTAGAR